MRAREWFDRGLPLIGKVSRELAIDLELFSRGGQEILNAIEHQDYAVLGNRPAISKSRKLALVARAAIQQTAMSTIAENPMQFAPTESQLHMAYSVCRGITRQRAKNFYYGFLVLPKRKRQALCAVYAFMRRCDDIADDPSLSAADRRQRLDSWVDAFHSALAGLPTDDPILLAITDAQRRFAISVGLLDQLAFGTAMDTEEANADPAVPSRPIQYRNFHELERYCYNVASVVGLVCIRIFGYSDPAAEPLAEKIGLAFQLTNIIRDVKEDADLGRVYLPEDDLARFGLSSADLAPSPNPARIRPLARTPSRTRIRKLSRRR